METTLKKYSEKVKKAIELVANGCATQYISLEDEKGEAWTVRVSNHKANPQRISGNTISLIVEIEEEENEEIGGFHINKKDFRFVARQHYVDNNGEFSENFRSLDEMLEYYLF